MPTEVNALELCQAFRGQGRPAVGPSASMIEGAVSHRVLQLIERFSCSRFHGWPAAAPRTRQHVEPERPAHQVRPVVVPRRWPMRRPAPASRSASRRASRASPAGIARHPQSDGHGSPRLGRAGAPPRALEQHGRQHGPPRTRANDRAGRIRYRGRDARFGCGAMKLAQLRLETRKASRLRRSPGLPPNVKPTNWCLRPPAGALPAVIP